MALPLHVTLTESQIHETRDTTCFIVTPRARADNALNLVLALALALTSKSSRTDTCLYMA